MEQTKHPPLLKALCILTFMGSGIGFIAYSFMVLFFEKASQMVISVGNSQSMDGTSPFYFALFVALYAVLLAGGIRMWKFHKDGYFMYLLAQLLILFLPVVQLGWLAFSSVNALFALVFIAGYSINYSHLK